MSAAHEAAPAALPDLATLDPTALANSSALLSTLQDPIAAMGDAEWYGFGLTSSEIEARLIGLPFTAEVDVFAYKTAMFDSPPLTWGSLFTDQGSFLIPAADPHSLFLVAEYLAMSGEFDPESDLDAAVLAEALGFLSAASESGALSPESLDLVSASETWRTLRNGQDGAAQAPFEEFAASYNPTVYAAGPFPTSDGNGISLASAWLWAIPVGSAGDLATELLEWLSEPGFLAEWSHALGMLPTQPEVLALWPDGPETAIASRLASVALPMPNEAVMSLYGPRFAAALQSVLSGDLTPAAAADQAAGGSPAG
jgi:hypothetical protein